MQKVQFTKCWDGFSYDAEILAVQVCAIYHNRLAESGHSTSGNFLAQTIFYLVFLLKQNLWLVSSVTLSYHHVGGFCG